MLAVLASGAVGAASASASSWWVGGTGLTSSASLASSTTRTQAVRFQFSGQTIECLGVELKSADLVGHSGGQVEHLVFTSCAMEANSKCSLKGTKIESKPLKIEPALYGKSPEDKVVLKPVTGTLFMEASFLGATCRIRKKTPNSKDR